MNQYPSQDPYSRQTPRQNPKKYPGKQRDKLFGVLIAFIGMLVVIGVISLAVLLGRYGPSIKARLGERYVQYDGFRVRVYDNLEKAEYRTEGFTKNAQGLLSYDDGEIKGVCGIDVSSHQGKIDWERVAKAGVQFAFIRIGYRGYSEGLMNLDERFAENYEGAKKAGLSVGVYFYSQAVTEEEARREAEYALTLLGERTLELPMVIDWEYTEQQTARTSEISGNTLTALSVAFCQVVEEHGLRAAVYFNKSTGYNAYNLSKLADYDFWIADYTEMPRFYYQHAFWQYSESGTVDGISEKVDLNLWFTKK